MTNGSSASSVGSSATRMGVLRQRVSTSACSVTATGSLPCTRRFNASPSALRNVSTTVDGSASRVCLGRAAPDRRDAHLMQVLVRADVHLSDRTGERGVAAGAGIGHAVQQDDLSTNINCGKVITATVPGIDDRTVQPTRRRGSGEGVRDAIGCVGLDLDFRSSRQADVGVMQDQVGLVTISVERGLQIAEALQLLRRARQLHAFARIPPGGASSRRHRRMRRDR